MNKKLKKIKKKPDEFWHKRKFVLSADPFDTDVGFFINTTELEVKKHLKKISGEKYKEFDEKLLADWDNSKNNLGRMIPFSGGFIILLKADKHHFRKFVGTLVHEVIHAVHYMLRDRRIDLCEHTEEIYTYSVEHLTRTALFKIY